MKLYHNGKDYTIVLKPDGLTFHINLLLDDDLLSTAEITYGADNGFIRPGLEKRLIGEYAPSKFKARMEQFGRDNALTHIGIYMLKCLDNPSK